MIKSRTAQLIYQTIYCTLGFVGIIACLGIFDDITMIRWDFYVHFTNLSNFLCIGVMFSALIQTIKKKEDGYVTAVPRLKFISMLGILLTFFVFNLLLAGAADRDPQLNWRVGSLCFHVVLPIMYIADWFLFYERKKIKWYYPILSIAFPLTYMLFIFIQAAIMKFDTSILIPGTNTPLIYPYFFVNLETQGVVGVAKWMAILLAAFVSVGFVFFGIDNIGKKSGK
ncbi:MAG: Pr6Pr family membrane protein [Anaerotignum sp.]|nr:Pr6Pr family membrane protein [Anaerotignum sp.]